MVNVPELESLASRTSVLGSKVDFWNSMVLYGLLAAAAVGAAIFFSQRQAFVRAKQLAGVQDQMAVIKETQIASLQKDALDAKTAQQRVEINLAEQREKTATAERSLLELQRRMEPRRLSAEQRARLVEVLKHRPRGKVTIMGVMGEQEGSVFAADINAALLAAGWDTGGGVGSNFYTGVAPVGFGILVHSEKSAPAYIVGLQHAFFSIGVPLSAEVNSALPEGSAQIVVGTKPH